MLGWKELVGKLNAKHSWPIKVKKNVLIVGCSSPSWAQTMMMLRGQIMEKIAALHGDCQLEDIHFSGVRQAQQMAEEEGAEKPLGEEFKLSDEDLARIDDTVKDISDETLKRGARAALISMLRQRRWHEQHGTKRCMKCDRLHHNKSELCTDCEKSA